MLQVGAKLAAKSDPLLHVFPKLILEWIWEPFGVDFGSALGSKIEFESVPNLRKLKCSKCYYLQYETLFSMSQGVPKLKKNRYQDGVEIEPSLESTFGAASEAKLVPKRKPKSVQTPIVS